MSYRVMRRAEVEKAVGLSRSTIYDLMSRGQFPKPIKLGERAVGWRESDVEKWLAEREVA
jgi:prophage regulatory protein